MIYTSSKALQFLSIPVYTIFKNLTIILIAYGEVLWFGGSVSGMALFSFGLMVVSSIVAAWADISAALGSYGGSAQAAEQLSTLNAGYIWVLVNCLSSASYVLGMRKRIKLTNFKDFDSMSSPPLQTQESVNHTNISQLCSTTTFSPSLCFLSAPSSLRTGHTPTSTQTFPRTAATASSSP